MKTLILYASKYGCTEDCAKYLKSKLKHETDIVNLKNPGASNLQNYDWIIIGGSILAGMVQKEVKNFCKQNLQLLLSKNIGLFICCTTPEQLDEYFRINFPAELLKRSAATVNFGGEIRYQKLGFFAKRIVDIVSKSKSGGTGILYKNIDQLAMSVNSQA